MAIQVMQPPLHLKHLEAILLSMSKNPRQALELMQFEQVCLLPSVFSMLTVIVYMYGHTAIFLPTVLHKS